MNASKELPEMSDTPRTDAAEIRCVDEPVEPLGMVEVDFARQLERELNEAKNQIDRLETKLNDIELIMQRPASNHRMMQIADPARRVLNIIKQVKEYKHRAGTTATVVKNLRALRANVEGGAR